MPNDYTRAVLQVDMDDEGITEILDTLIELLQDELGKPDAKDYKETWRINNRAYIDLLKLSKKLEGM